MPFQVTKNSYGVANIGSHGLYTENKIGGYTKQGRLRIEFDDGKYTIVFYYNRPDKAIPYAGGWYMHDELPAYMIRWEGNWHVGTAEQIRTLIRNNRHRFS